MNYTSIEQSKKLLELGLSPESADMYWAYTDKQNYVGLGNPPCDVTFGSPDEKAEIIPCWSVGALLEIIPMVERGSMELYKDWEYKYTLQNDYYCTPRFNTPIEAAYNMVVWLLENNYIKQ